MEGNDIPDPWDGCIPRIQGNAMHGVDQDTYRVDQTELVVSARFPTACILQNAPVFVAIAQATSSDSVHSQGKSSAVPTIAGG